MTPARETDGRPAPRNPAYTRHHPRWHRERIPIFWWLRSPAYAKFISRELTSVFVAYAVLLLAVQVVFLGRGPEAYAAFQEWVARPWVRALNGFTLVALVFHTVTWLNAAPQALVVRLGGRRVPTRLVLLGHYAAWVAVSAALLWLFVGRSS